LRKLELRIWELVDESIIANHDKKWKKALELGKDAELKEKVLQKQEEEEGYFQSHNWDLTFSVSQTNPKNSFHSNPILLRSPLKMCR